MRLHHAIYFVLGSFVASTALASDVSWIFRPGYYTHSPVTGQRVAQYEPEKLSIVPTDPTYQESGYRHQLVQVGTDWLNLVQTWGAGTAIRPYGEWEYPYRAGATPFGPWGNPQGPWTLPFDSWQNPYALNRLPYGNGPGSSSGPAQAGVGVWQGQRGQTHAGSDAAARPASGAAGQCFAPATGRADPAEWAVHFKTLPIGDWVARLARNSFRLANFQLIQSSRARFPRPEG